MVPAVSFKNSLVLPVLFSTRNYVRGKEVSSGPSCILLSSKCMKDIQRPAVSPVTQVTIIFLFYHEIS